MSASVVILVRPQLGENIGAVARAMNNFGLSDLRLVAPKNGWPNERAYDMATGNASTILDALTLHDTAGDALKDIQRAYATTSRNRFMEKPVITAREAAGEARAAVASGLRTAFVFGPERTGLENEDLILCDALVTIPTGGPNPSLNISQAAVILAYEWTCASPHLPRFTRGDEAAPKEELEGLFIQLEEHLDALNHFRTEEKKGLMWQNLRNSFVRAQMSSQEIRSFRGMIRALFERRLQD